ncbi:class I SAM-dependent methyltransferase [Aerophototrophica crusticola]|uniref:Class I SAM-dependent methyltransferase n=1 Tax=Aerophototrophica crusticola TaxID=1709002 RepID=A0A858R7S6_9PROT|nr:class I SAM-dependent methyltransferase [Rhodospirillaceae bacterium B3]
MTTALQDIIARRIALAGPLSVAEYMALCLGHPQHGYYMTRDPLGAAGDFTTAPEISQMFGELLGLWAAQCWIQMGQPGSVQLVELGPGRGTLMADALRATARLPGFHQAVRLHLVETSPVLRQRQAAALGKYGPNWHDRLAEVPDGPMLLLANEFFDALPVRQFQKGPRGRWAERKVGLDDAGNLSWKLDPTAGDALVHPSLRAAPEGSMVEICPAGVAIAAEIGARLAAHPGAALFVDYGYAGPAVGDTVQALRRHAFVPVLEAPGEADLTAHVDFTALGEAAATAGAAAYAPVPQRDFLISLGIEQRAAALKRLATPVQAGDIDAALHRLVGDVSMGRLFKAQALASPGLPAPAGFEQQT